MTIARKKWEDLTPRERDALAAEHVMGWPNSDSPAERSRVMMPARDADRWALVRSDAVLYWTTGQDSGRPAGAYVEAV